MISIPFPGLLGLTALFGVFGLLDRAPSAAFKIQNSRFKVQSSRFKLQGSKLLTFLFLLRKIWEREHICQLLS